MSNLENLTSKILEDSKVKAEEILQKAKEEADKILKQKSDSAEAVKKSFIDKAMAEAESKKARIISNAELKGRNIKLKAKQQVIADVYSKAVEELGNMSAEEFKAYLKNNVESLKLSGGEEIILSEKFKSVIDDNMINELKLVRSNDNREIPEGFIIVCKGIEYNFTFEALVASMKKELEHEVASMLFQ
ncbi:V/A-type H+-transporting ATPase subunit E [Hathewaya proteolytica DSM 3090]|uniref:V-type proton ATPase subunit E n=1 Tax=Hathewaya proteolytica DSM 3090 TaxID=1121331 RepID=A0A1M6LFI2_9CLOT|nr:V-type ATP synthase subunit E [Hathewaya proteolytica]SHJ69942.1 V/A-type H+-transporting ATPase subunit E [Hathewaya proteolytica DSM 3090]